MMFFAASEGREKEKSQWGMRTSVDSCFLEGGDRAVTGGIVIRICCRMFCFVDERQRMRESW